jgi:hypothetical protein
MRKWMVDVRARNGDYFLRLMENRPDGGGRPWATCDLTGGDAPVWMWFRPMESRIALAVKWAIAKVRAIEADDVTQADAEVMAARWTKAAQAMFAEGAKEVAR